MKSSIRFLVTFLAATAAAVMFSSCVTTPEKKHVYDYGDDDGVSSLPHTRPESFEGNPMGNMPQSR